MELLIDILIANQRWIAGSIVLLLVVVILLVFILEIRRQKRLLLKNRQRRVRYRRKSRPTNSFISPNSRSGHFANEFLLSLDMGSQPLFRMSKFRMSLILLLLVFSSISIEEPIPKSAFLEFPGPVCESEQTDLYIVFIHGWNGDNAETWKNFPSLVCNDKYLTNTKVVSIGYPTYMVRRNLTIPQLAEWINTSIESRLTPKPESKFVIVAHSMGGLIARELTLLRKLSEKAPAVETIVSIGTPHRGANPAGIANALGLSREFTSDMKEGSSLLAGLQVKWNSLNKKPNTFCYSSPHDLVVSETSALFQCEHIFSYPQWDHSELVKPNNEMDDRYLFPMNNIKNSLAKIVKTET